MQLLTPAQVDRIYGVTDSFGLHRNWVVLPLAAGETGSEQVMPDGKLMLKAPNAPALESWIAELPDRLRRLNLSRTPRAHQHDPILVNTPLDAPPGSGPHRTMNMDVSQKQAWRGGESPPPAKIKI